MVIGGTGEAPLGLENGPKMCNDGKLLWTINPTGGPSAVKCYDIVSMHRKILDQSYVVDVTPIANAGHFVEINVPLYPLQITSLGDRAFIACADSQFTGGRFDQLVIVNTVGTIERTIKLPETMKSNLAITNNKVWMVSDDHNANFQQILHWYDLSTETFGQAPIPCRHQVEPRVLARDYNGFILVADYNNLSITKFTNAGTFVSTTRVAAAGSAANREPGHFTINHNKEVFISSFNGMISKMNTMNDTFTWYSTGLGDVTSMSDDGTFQWVATQKIASTVNFKGKVYKCKESHIARGTEPDDKKWDIESDPKVKAEDGSWTAGSYYVDDKGDILRIQKTSQKLRHFSTEERDIKIEDNSIAPVVGSSVNSILSTPSFVVETDVGLLTIPGYTWALTDTSHIIGFQAGPMFRENTYEMKGLAMISYGNYDYTGD